jgi:hypothetical protein
MKKIIVKVNASTLSGRRILRELEKHDKVVTIENPLPVGEDGLTLKTYSLEETFDNLYDKLEHHYKVDLRKV